MEHLDLFSGIGGFALACEWAGIETICFVEIDKYCQKVLRKHWPSVPIVGDIRDVEKIKEIVANATREGFPDRRRASVAVSGQEEPESKRCYSQPDRLQEHSGNHRRASGNGSVTLITAGFPCQPFSVAGKRGGERDDRYLWPETIAVIKAIKPRWVLLENVTGIINLALDTVLSDLEGAGYSTETLIIPACAVNAPHRRDRVWIVAHSQCCRCDSGEHRLSREPNTASGADDTQSEQDRARQGSRISKASQDVPDSQQSTSRRGRFTGHSNGQRGQRAEAKQEGLQSTDGAARPDNLESGSQDVADTEGIRQRPSRDTIGNTIQRKNRSNLFEISSGKIPVADAQREGLEGADTEGSSCSTGQPMQSDTDPKGNGIQSRESIIDSPIGRDWWAVEPELGRVAHGIPYRVDRLKCLGNAIAPPLAYEIIKVIKEYEGQT